MRGQKTLVGYVTGAEVVKRTWILTITGEDVGPSPAEIKQGIYNISMDLAPKLPGARMVTVGLAHIGKGPEVRRGARVARVGRTRAKAVRASKPDVEAPDERKRRLRKNKLQRKWRKQRAEGTVDSTLTGTKRAIDPTKAVSSDKAFEIYQQSNGKLTQPHRLVISHLMGWGTKKMSRRQIGREFSLGGGGERTVRQIAQEGWKQLGLVRIKNGFEALNT